MGVINHLGLNKLFTRWFHKFLCPNLVQKLSWVKIQNKTTYLRTDYKNAGFKRFGVGETMWWKVFISKWLCSTNFQILAPLVITWSSISSVPNGIMLWIAALWIEASKLLKRWFPECTWENWQDKSLLICVGKVNAIYFNVLYSQKATKIWWNLHISFEIT